MRLISPLVVLLLVLGPAQADPRVALPEGPGIWPEGHAALEQLLTDADLAPAVAPIGSCITAAPAVLVLGGGWAVDQRLALGEDGPQRLRDYVSEGGAVLAICAAAYLLADDVEWEGVHYPYDVDLFDGVAAGPLADLAPWPQQAPVELHGVRGPHPLQRGGSLRAVYFGGPRLRPHAPDEVWILLRYPDGTPAAVAITYGRGRVILCGPHLEFDQPERLVAWCRWLIDPDAR